MFRMMFVANIILSRISPDKRFHLVLPASEEKMEVKQTSAIATQWRKIPNCAKLFWCSASVATNFHYAKAKYLQTKQLPRIVIVAIITLRCPLIRPYTVQTHTHTSTHSRTHEAWSIQRKVLLIFNIMGIWECQSSIYRQFRLFIGGSRWPAV